MVETMCAKKLSSPPTMDDTPISSTRSDLFRDRFTCSGQKLTKKSLASARLPSENLLTLIGWVQSQCFQRFGTSVKKERYPVHFIEIHVAKSDSPEQVNQIHQEAYPREPRHHQRSSQWRGEGWDERWVVWWFHLITSPVVEEFEIFRVLEESDKVDNLAAGSFGLSEGEGSDGG